MAMLRFGYITNGLRDHTLDAAFALLADLGYQGVGITLDVGHLDPRTAGPAEVQAVRASLSRHGLEAVVETGARYILDPVRKHQPTLLSARAEGRKARLDLLLRAVEIAAALDAKVVSFWSGAKDPGVGEDATWAHLLEALGAVCEAARSHGVTTGFEPEPGMFVEGVADVRELLARGAPEDLRLTLDLGHLQCTEEPPLDRWVRELGPLIVNVHVDDGRDRVHEHLPLGDGEIDFPPLLRELESMGYAGLCLVELARHSHAAPELARRSIEFLRAC